ncbi:transcriptional regulator FtsR [Saccharothrix yanglingensis]|uniref:transcriptional regulator FtsR n=1 Tax=Saccharothrix yanglingensis TaxID=659496 RepID=UPI0027D2FEDE|nr:MerR family transcriptional regulator [Saccharothrix yanglingensis]
MTAGRPRGGSGIGAVLALLRADFPDVTISKIRFLEAEGLVRPARTASGYRQFSSADVERLRYVLTAQRDRYLPLRVIREQLDAADASSPDGGPGCPAGGPPRVHRVTRDELLARAGISPDVLADLEQHGLVTPSPGGSYDHDAVQIASTVRALADHGLDVRRLRPFRAAADVVVTAARQGRVDDVTALSVTLHTLLVKTGLRDVAGGRVSPR